MKRGGAEVAPADLERVRRADSSMGLQSQIPSAVAGGTRPTVPCQNEPASTTQGVGSSNAVASIGRGPRAHAAMLVRASLWAAVHVVQAAFGRVVECGRVKCA